MKQYFILLFFGSLLFFNFQCNDCENERHDNTSFSAAISPLKTVYNIGDTISIGTSFSSLIELETSRTTHDNSGQMISYVVQIFEVKPMNERVTDGIEDFELISRIGQIGDSPYYDKRFAVEINNTCDTDQCEFLLEVIPTKSGIYCFSLLNSKFGEAECDHFSLVENNFGLTGNNFGICQEINTTQFSLEGGAFYSNPEDIARFYFFKVE